MENSIVNCTNKWKIKRIFFQKYEDDKVEKVNMKTANF